MGERSFDADAPTDPLVIARLVVRYELKKNKRSHTMSRGISFSIEEASRDFADLTWKP